jgi:hypothetical protein
MLIFDHFPTIANAQDFAHWVGRKGLAASVHTSAADARQRDYFPFMLEPPIVLVERQKTYEEEEAIDKAARTFGGRFAGT